MKTRWKILFGLAVVAGMVVLAAVVHHFQLKAAVARYKAELKARGEPMELAEVIPPRVPPEKNSAGQFLAATRLFETNENVLATNWPSAMRGVAPGKAQIAWQQKLISDYGMTNSWDDLTLALDANKEAFQQLVIITNSPVFDFGLRYEQRSEMLITNLIMEKRAAQKLSAKTLNDLRLGKTESAAENIRAMLALVEGTYDERTAISQLVRFAITQITCGATWEFLQSSNLTETQLAGLQIDWSRPEFIQATANVLPVERECCQAAVASWRKSTKELLRIAGYSKKAGETMGYAVEEETTISKLKQPGQIILWRYWWSYPDELRGLHGYEVLMDTMRTVMTNGSFQTAISKQTTSLDDLGFSKIDGSLEKMYSGKLDFHNMFSDSIVVLSALPKKVLKTEAARQSAIAAIALKRFQLRHGSYPPSLNALVPEFLASVPHDPMDGKILRYHLQTDGTFLLYSIGENGEDDGGNPALEKNVETSGFNWLNPHALDWVWPQPATADEIQKYYEEQAKK